MKGGGGGGEGGARSSKNAFNCENILTFSSCILK